MPVRHIISLLLENEPGALCRVANLFSARGYNIESLSVAATEDPSVSRMTLVTEGSDSVIEQITKQLNKLVDVVRLVDITEAAHVERELMLIKVRKTQAQREEIERLCDAFHGRILDETDTTRVVELIGDRAKNDAFIEKIPDGALILEVVRSGVLGIGRGEKVLRV